MAKKINFRIKKRYYPPEKIMGSNKQELFKLFDLYRSASNPKDIADLEKLLGSIFSQVKFRRTKTHIGIYIPKIIKKNMIGAQTILVQDVKSVQRFNKEIREKSRELVDVSFPTILALLENFSNKIRLAENVLEEIILKLRKFTGELFAFEVKLNKIVQDVTLRKQLQKILETTENDISSLALRVKEQIIFDVEDILKLAKELTPKKMILRVLDKTIEF